MIKIDKNTKGVAMFDRTQWFLVDMSIALSVQLPQIPGLLSTVAAAYKPVFKVLNINQIKRIRQVLRQLSW